MTGKEYKGSHTPLDDPDAPPAEATWVLVADDDPGTRLLLRKKLEKAGYAVICAKTGKEAVNRLTDKVAAAVIDLKMPEGDGLFCLRYIRAHFPDLVPLMLTASDNVANAVEAMKQGALDYVTKPFNPGQVTALVDKAVKTHEQARRLKAAEKKLEQARQHQLFVASQIQRTLLLGRPPADLAEMPIGHLTLPSQHIDGDFYDFIRLGPRVVDIIVADIMGKGIMAAFMGAALKSAFLRVINEFKFSGRIKVGLPEPEQIVSAVHDNMIAQMEELETFVTLCYGRFDLNRYHFVFVDCGHVRTIHYQHRKKDVELLRGANMPLGFPEKNPFQQFTVPFAPGDLFLFYSDGVTEAANNDGDLYDEPRLVAQVQKNADLPPDELIRSIKDDVVAFAGTGVFNDDFTCVCTRILPPEATHRVIDTRDLEIDSSLGRLREVRSFVNGFCRRNASDRLDENRISQVEVAATEIVTNIIKHGFDQEPGHPIRITAAFFRDRIEIAFFDDGKPFDAQSIPPPVLDGSQENGMGCYLISQFVDEIEYYRDENEGKNCARIKIMLFAGGVTG